MDMDDNVVWSSPGALSERVSIQVSLHLLVVHIDYIELYALVCVRQLGRLCVYQPSHGNSGSTGAALITQLHMHDTPALPRMGK